MCCVFVIKLADDDLVQVLSVLFTHAYSFFIGFGVFFSLELIWLLMAPFCLNANLLTISIQPTQLAF